MQQPHPGLSVLDLLLHILEVLRHDGYAVTILLEGGVDGLQLLLHVLQQGLGEAPGGCGARSQSPSHRSACASATCACFQDQSHDAKHLNVGVQSPVLCVGEGGQERRRFRALSGHNERLHGREDVCVRAFSVPVLATSAKYGKVVGSEWSQK